MTGETQFHVLSFEGPDDYAHAGGIASRITGLTDALAADFETHLWFIGAPDLPGTERRGRLTIHRWCQWISRHHPGGVYDGEEEKRADFVRSLPPALHQDVLLPWLQQEGGRAIILAEEWQTADAVLHLDWLLRRAGVRDRVVILWNANNTFGFHRIDWPRLAAAARITTVSRYMRYRMWEVGVDPLVLPNGLSREAFEPPAREAVAAFRGRTRGRLVVTKVARWDPDKRWLLAIDTVGALKRAGCRPLLVARGGVEAHGSEVLARAAAQGLRIVDRTMSPGVRGLVEGLSSLEHADVLNVHSRLVPEVARVLFRGAEAVLANSGHEPFGLVGLEAMAAGGLACTGNTGEDYAVPGWNAVVLQTDSPGEFVRHLERLRAHPDELRAVRRRGARTARRYAWAEIIGRSLLPHVHVLAGRHEPGTSIRAEPESAQPRSRVAAPEAA